MQYTLAPSKPRKPWYKLQRVGGLLHWRIGRIGGSFYIARRNNTRTGA